MPDVETSPLNNILNVRRRLRDDALQMGPRKKMYDPFLSSYNFDWYTPLTQSDVLRTLLFTMVVILAVPSMHSAMFMLL